MKKFMLALSLSLAIGAVITLNSCKKVETTTAADDSVSAKDNNSVSNAVNATSDDAAATAGQVKTMSGKTYGFGNSAFGLICGIQTFVFDTLGTNHTITVTYDGINTCNGIIRTGTVTITGNGIPWNTAGSALSITYNGLKVYDPITQETYTLTGTHTLTKETSGLEWEVITGLTPNVVVTRRNTGNLTITFADGSQRNWTVDRTRSWSNSANGLTPAVSIYSEAANNIDVTGTNRFGLAFTNAINIPVMANSNCGWRPYQGQLTHSVANRTATVVYGTDSNGTPDGSATATGANCSQGYYITYTKNGSVRGVKFVPYW